MRADFSIRKQQKSVLSGAKQIFQTSVLPLHICGFPHVSSGCSVAETNSLLIRENSTCIILTLRLALVFFTYRQCEQYCHNLFGFGNWSFTSNMALIWHCTCGFCTFRHGTGEIWQTWHLSIKTLSFIWSRKICSSYSVTVSAPYSFHMQNSSSVHYCQTNYQGVSQGGILSFIWKIFQTLKAVFWGTCDK